MAESLHRFRLAAEQVRASSIIDQGLTVVLQRRVRTPMGDPEADDVVEFVRAELLPAEPLLALAVPVRRVLLDNEPGNIYRVCKILRGGDEATAARAVAVRKRLQSALRLGADSHFHALVFFGEPVELTLREVLDAWLYTANFHDEGDHEAAYRTLSAYGERFHVAVQFAVLQVAGRVLDMDDVVADYLGEARLRRIMPDAMHDPASSGAPDPS